MKRVLFSILAIFILATLPLAALADGTDQHNATISEVLTEIRTQTGVATNDDIDAGKVSDSLLEKLGEAVMSVAHPDSREHQYMDAMMGGEGSESLKAMHRRMGYMYITNGLQDDFSCFRSGRGMGGSWMMNGNGYRGGMMNYSPGFNHHGYSHMGWFGWGFYPVFWILLIPLLVVLTVFGVHTFRKTRDQQDPLTIAKTRYAKGEISKDEYNTLRDELNRR